MTTYLCISLIVVGFVLLSGTPKAALTVGLIAMAGGFGYRIYLGNELRAVMADVLFVLTLFPIGWWAATRWLALVDVKPTTNGD